jgi:RNA polymerase sigma-70 factor (ECF subfamily)
MAMDQTTLHAFASGSSAAVRVVYAEYNTQVFTVTMSMLGNRALAEEALQQTFLNAWRRASSFDPSRSIAPWLYAIARRASIDIH